MPQWFFDILGLIILFGIATLLLSVVLILLGLHRFRKPFRYGASTQILRNLPVDPEDMGLEFDELKTQRGDYYWRIYGQSPESKTGPILIYLHPWSGSRFEIVHLLSHFADRFSTTYLWDMTGHGEAKGAFDGGMQSLEDLREIMIAALDHQPGQQLVLMGRGLGFHLALKAPHEQVCAIIGDALVKDPMEPVHRFYRQYRLPNVSAAVSLVARLFGCRPDFLHLETIPRLARDIRLLTGFTISSREEALAELDGFLDLKVDASATALTQTDHEDSS